MRILLLNGPNLNLLGTREPDIYGSDTLADVETRVRALVEEDGHELTAVQSNSEGALVDALQDAGSWADGVIFNPAGYTHTSVAIRDAVSAIPCPVVEVHLSNPAGREEFRHHSFMAPVCVGTVAGFGIASYEAAWVGLAHHLRGGK